mgnify:CR=1 FL=1
MNNRNAVLIAILFLIFLFIGRAVVTNPMAQKNLLVFSLGLFAVFAYLSYKNTFIAIMAFLLYLPFYSWAKYRIFGNSQLGNLSKDLMLGMIFLSWMIKRITGKSGTLNLPPCWTTMIPFFLVATLNIFKAPSIVGGILDWRIQVFYPLTSIVFFDELRDREKFYKLLRALVIAGSIVALIGIFQRIFYQRYGKMLAENMFGAEAIKTYFLENRSEILITSTVGWHGVLGLYLTFCIGFLFILFTDRRQFMPKWAFISLFVLFTVTLVFTNNRTSWVAFIVLFIFVFIRNRRQRAGLIAMMAVVFTLFIVNNSFFKQRFSDILDPLDQESSFNMRYQGWREYLNVVLENPFGLGLGHVGMTASSKSTRVDVDLMQMRGYKRIIDNMYIMIVMATGYPGFLFYVIFWIAYLAWAFSVHRERKSSITVVGTAMLCITLISGITGEYVNYILLQMYFWVSMAGVLIAERDPERRPAIKEIE